MNKINIFKNINRYDLLIILVIVSLAYGQHEILRAFHPIRIIGMLAFPFVFLRIKTLLNSIFRPYVIFIIFWWSYMLLSLIWTPDKHEGIIYLYHMSVMFIIIMFMILCGIKANKPLLSLINGWTVFCLVVLPIAYWEITTGNHLFSGSYNDGMRLGEGLRIFAAVTFVNLNSFVLMLAIALPFVGIGLFNDLKQSKCLKLLRWVVFIGIAMVLIINASRVGVLCLFFSVLFLIIYKFKQYPLMGKVVFLLFLFVSVPYIINRISSIEGVQQISTRLDGKSSIIEDDERTRMIFTGIDISSESLFVGGGAASMIPLYKDHVAGLRMYYAHNLIIELLMEYGFVICLLFIVYYYKYLFKIWRMPNYSMKYLFLYTLFASPFMFSIDDSYQWRTSIWMQIASLFVLISANSNPINGIQKNDSLYYRSK